MGKLFKLDSKIFQGLKSHIKNKGNLKGINTFIVNKKLTKPEIKYLIEELFNVRILKINTQNLPLKYKKIKNKKIIQPHYKKVIVKLMTGNSILY